MSDAWAVYPLELLTVGTIYPFSLSPKANNCFSIISELNNRE